MVAGEEVVLLRGRNTVSEVGSSLMKETVEAVTDLIVGITARDGQIIDPVLTILIARAETAARVTAWQPGILRASRAAMNPAMTGRSVVSVPDDLKSSYVRLRSVTETTMPIRNRVTR